MQILPKISFYLFLTLIYAQKPAAPDHWIGTWKLNPAKSHYRSGTLPKNRILNFAAVTGGVKATSDLLDDIGVVHIEFEAQYNGPDVAMRGGDLGNPRPTISVKRTDAYIFDTFQMSGRNVVVTTHFVVSSDGKVLTATASGLDSKGQKYSNVSVYDKQP